MQRPGIVRQQPYLSAWQRFVPVTARECLPKRTTGPELINGVVISGIAALISSFCYHKQIGMVQMKKVAYAGAALGLAPLAALAVTTVNPAHAAAAANSPISSHLGKTKTVSLHGLGRAAVPDTSCTGVKSTNTAQGHADLQYWYQTSGCVGTVEGVINSSAANGFDPHPSAYRIRIWYNGTLEWSKTVGVTLNLTMDGNSYYTADYAVPG
jgi:hypothetical protein